MKWNFYDIETEEPLDSGIVKSMLHYFGLDEKDIPTKSNDTINLIAKYKKELSYSFA